LELYDFGGINSDGDYWNDSKNEDKKLYQKKQMLKKHVDHYGLDREGFG
jgi:hypothetical protein